MKKLFAGLYAFMLVLAVSTLVYPAGFFEQGQAPEGGYPPSPTFIHPSATWVTVTDNVTGPKGYFSSFVQTPTLTGSGSGDATGYRMGSFSDNVTTPDLVGDGTGDLSNYLNIVGAGSGAISGFEITSKALDFALDNTYDIGASGVARPRNLYLANTLSVSGAGPHSIGGIDGGGESVLNVGGTFSGGTTDIRAININAALYMRALYSSEGINVRPGFVVPATGAVASAEGVHVDLSNADWDNGGTVSDVYAFRVRGVPLHSAVQTATGIFIESGFGTNASVAHYNILSAGVAARNRFDGIMEVYGPAGHTIGSAGSSTPYVGLLVDPIVTDQTGGVYGSALMRIGWSGGSVSPPATRDGYGLIVNPTIIEAASGVHSDFVGTQFNVLAITDGAGSVTNATTVKIIGAPTAGTSANYALWIDNQGAGGGLVRWDDPIALGGGAAPTFGTIGGSGPATAGQARWLRVNIDGTDSFIPVWQ